MKVWKLYVGNFECSDDFSLKSNFKAENQEQHRYNDVGIQWNIGAKNFLLVVNTGFLL